QDRVRGVARDASRVARLMQVEQPQPQLGEHEQLVTGPREEVQVLAGQFRAYGDVPLLIDEPAQPGRLIVPRGRLLAADEDGLQLFAELLTLRIFRLVCVHRSSGP